MRIWKVPSLALVAVFAASSLTPAGALSRGPLLDRIQSLRGAPQITSTVTVPSKIPSNCSRDVTADLNTWIASVPNGTAIKFRSGGCYKIERSLMFKNRADLIVDGAGAWFRSYAKGPISRYGYSERRHFWCIGSRRVTFRNIKLRGSNTVPDQKEGFGAYHYQFEFEHGFALHECHDTVVEDSYVDAVWGDGLYIGNHYPSTNIRVSGLVIDRNGRQGVALSNADGVLIERVKVLHGRRAGFDLEPPPGNVRNVEIRYSYTRSIGLAYASAGWNDVSNIHIHHNQIDGGGVPWVYVRASNGARRHDWRVHDNTVIKTLGSPMPALYFVNVDNVEVRNNITKISVNQSRKAVQFINAGGTLVVLNNDFTGACAPYVKDTLTGPVIALGNTVSDCTP